MARKLIAGNWKMNGSPAFAKDLAGALREKLSGGGAPDADFVLCPPFPLIPLVAELVQGSGIAVGAQDCHAAKSGAHTGDTSAELLSALGCSYVIVGHSERRTDHGEGDELVKAKAQAALNQGMTPIVCIGETEEERAAGQTLAVIETQVTDSLPDEGKAADIVLAYEPVWAIGTGKTATPDDVKEVHAFIRALLEKRFGAEAATVKVLYGGSVKPSNAAELLAVENVDGALVGGASLVAEDFWAIGVR